MILSTYTKQPSEIKDYDIDYGPWLLSMGDTLNEVTTPETVECLTDPDDTSLKCTQVLYSATAAKFWLSGGTAGNRYKLTARAETVEGRLDESELVFTIKEY